MPLLDLPPELRNNIYEYLAANDLIIGISKWTLYRRHHPLLHVCQQTRHEMRCIITRHPKITTASIKQCFRGRSDTRRPERWLENVVHNLPGTSFRLTLTFMVSSDSAALENDNVDGSSLGRVLHDLQRTYSLVQQRDLEKRRKQDVGFERFYVTWWLVAAIVACLK